MKTVLSLAAIAEAAAGAVLLAYPPIVARLLFGAEIAGEAEVLGRIAGIALIGLSVACWPDGSRRSALHGMLTYSMLAMLILAYVGIRGDFVGVLLWPAVVAHAILVMLLLSAQFKRGTGRAGDRGT